MASEDNVLESSSPAVNESDETQVQGLSQLLPLLLGLASRRQTPGSDSELRSGVRIISVDRASGIVIVMDGSGDLESMLQEASAKAGVLPASKDSIEAMPTVEVTEEGVECSICLEAYNVGGEAREMPCKHRFHSGCIEKWLGIHGSCPVCRFLMPVEKEQNKSGRIGDEEEEEEEDGGEGRGSGDGVLSVSVWVRTRRGDDPEDGDDDPVVGNDPEDGDDPMDIDSGNSDSYDEPRDMES